MPSPLARQPPATRLSRSLAAPARRRPEPADALQLGRRAFLDGRRIDIGAIAAELGVARATVFRWVGSRELLTGEVLWSFCAPVLTQAASGLRLRGARRIARLCERAIQRILQFEPLRRFIAADAEHALRMLTSQASPLQARLIGALREALEAERQRGELAPPLPLDTLAYLIVRIGESFLYADVISGQRIDPRHAGLAVELLLSGKLGAATSTTRR